MIRRSLIAFATGWCLLAATQAIGQDILMSRSRQDFPEAMLTLQDSIKGHGYEVTRVQRVDIGLTGMGYETDRYRVVFYAKVDEIRRLVTANPPMLAYLPPSISIFAENGQTVLVAADPRQFKSEFEDREMRILLDRWANDLNSIMEDVRRAE